MPRKRYTAEQIIRHIRHAEVLSSQHRSVSEICREIGVSENTYYRWRKVYGGMGVDQARRLKEQVKRIRIQYKNIKTIKPITYHAA